MAEANTEKISQLPDEMFSIIKASTAGLGPRLGRLALAGRTPIDTPHFLGNTSRGVVPHITQDNFSRHTNINGVYVGLEDSKNMFDPDENERAPKQIPPLYKFRPPYNPSPLRAFIAVPESPVVVLGARRTPPVAAPAANPNTHETVSVCTAVGFRTLRADDYAGAVEELGADIVIALGDVPYGRALGSKRVEKATDRTIAWLSEHVRRRREKEWDGRREGRLFAPMLPVTCANQQFHVDCLVDEVADEVDGLAFYDVKTLEDLPEKLQHLPRMGFTTPNTPHEVLRQIRLGVDVLTIPFINAATDAGIALDFTFPGTETNNGSNECLPLGIDLWPESHAVDMSPLMQGCQCYACTNHHRAYVQHLLSAKEMLAWVLLQIHNHHVMDLFLDAVRRSIAAETFEEDVQMFARVYESKMPEKTGQGPRVRGYQFKSEGPGEPKKNPSTFTMLNDEKEKLAESEPPTVVAGANELEEHGFAEKQETTQDHH